MVFNPTTEDRQENMTLPLYYSGLTDGAAMSIGGGAPAKVQLARDYSLTVTVSVPAKSSTWVLLTV